MKRMGLIAFREYLENVRTKGFWFGILMMPVVLVLFALVPALVESTREAKTYAVIDQSDGLLEQVNQSIDRRNFKAMLNDFRKGEEETLPPFLATIFPELRALDEQATAELIDYFFDGVPMEQTVTRRLETKLSTHRTDIMSWWQKLSHEDRARLSPSISTNNYQQISESDVGRLNSMIEDDSLFAYFIIGEDIVDAGEGARYVSNNLTDRDLETWFGNYLNTEVRRMRLQMVSVDKETADWINSRVAFEGMRLGDDGIEEEVDPTDIAKQWAPVIFVYFLWISILINTQMLITNTIEEKSNKLIEVLLSSVPAITLMGGKIIGIAATGLTIILAWLTMALAFFIGLPLLAGIELPVDLTNVIADPFFLLSFIMYFLLGYLLYAALLVGLGSLCNNLKEAQNLILPVQMIQIVPILMMVPIGRDPNGSLAQIMSYIPPLTPFVMMNRAAGPPTTFEYVVTTALLLVSIVGAFWLAAKMFRVGILMTGKPPGPMEIIKLMRAPVTRV